MDTCLESNAPVGQSAVANLQMLYGTEAEDESGSDTHTILVSGIHLLLIWVCPQDLLTIRKIQQNIKLTKSYGYL